MIDLEKIKTYYNYLSEHHVYAEGESPFHKELTTEVVKKFVDPLELPKDARILDLGCGPGYFLEEMANRHYTNVVGVTLSASDLEICLKKGFQVRQNDFSFLPDEDNSVDFIFLRHALEHSPFPIFSLMEFNRVLAAGGAIYIEVPAPNCERQYEHNANHYSIFDKTQLLALVQRSGFFVYLFHELSFTISDEQRAFKEHYYSLVATKPL